MGQNVIPVEYTKMATLGPLPNPKSQLDFILSPDLLQKNTSSLDTKHRQPTICRITHTIRNIWEAKLPTIEEILTSFRATIKDRLIFENPSYAQAGGIRIGQAVFVGIGVTIILLLLAAATDSILHPEEWITPTPVNTTEVTHVYTPPTQETAIPQTKIDTQTTTFINTFQSLIKQLQSKYPNVLDGKITPIITAQQSLFIIQPGQTVTQKIEQELGINGATKEERAKALQQYLGWNPQKQEHIHEIYVILIKNGPNGSVIYGGSSNEVFADPAFASVKPGDVVLVIPTQGENPQVYMEVMKGLQKICNNHPNRIHNSTH